MKQIKEDIRIFDKGFSKLMTEEEKQAYKNVRELYEEKIKVGCTGCSYCSPCPSNVNIPLIFLHYNRSFMGNSEMFKKDYKAFLCSTKIDASNCTECGQCEESCPQHLPVIDKLKEAHEYLMAD